MFKQDALRCVRLLKQGIHQVAFTDEAREVLNKFMKTQYTQLEEKLKLIIVSTNITFLGKMNFAEPHDPANKETAEKLLKDLDILEDALIK
ncbi:hypothetical protein ET464_16030 [Paenibacillus protaetiae]|uniref:Uncharacterized protein n=1 Tax=Paenibacillus protaetiae TaxID=2509456 RepID=A0A4P6EXX7_9BACL|nr:hypothetical protein ET464_16030 [Paenibacillus protaetiae]